MPSQYVRIDLCPGDYHHSIMKAKSMLEKHVAT